MIKWFEQYLFDFENKITVDSNDEVSIPDGDGGGRGGVGGGGRFLITGSSPFGGAGSTGIIVSVWKIKKSSFAEHWLCFCRCLVHPKSDHVSTLKSCIYSMKYPKSCIYSVKYPKSNEFNYKNKITNEAGYNPKHWLSCSTTHVILAIGENKNPVSYSSGQIKCMF